LNLATFIVRMNWHNANFLKIIKNIGWLSFGTILKAILGLTVGVWIARYLGPEQFGLLSFSISLVGLFGSFSGLGIKAVVVRDLVNDTKNRSAILGTAAFLQLISSVISYLFLIILITWLKYDDHLAKVMVAIIGSILLFKVSDIANYWFESQVLSKYVTWIQSTCGLVFASIKIILITMNSTLVYFAWITALEAFFTAIFLLVMFANSVLRLSKLRISFKIAKKLIYESWPLMISGFAITIYMKIDQIMIGQMISNDAVGLYSAATKISEAWYFVPMAIVASLTPSLVSLKKNNELLYLQRTQQLLDLMVFLSICVAFTMTFLSEVFISFLYGVAYDSAGLILAIHIWSAIFVFIGTASSKWFLLEGMQIHILQRALLGAILNIFFNFILINSHGPVGAAIATLIAQASGAMFYDFTQKSTRKLFYMKLKSFNIIRLIYFITHNVKIMITKN
jgi:O-antigen/teichoic acid export membrane protein